MEKKIIILTGATSMIGEALIQQLKDHQLILIARSKSKLDQLLSSMHFKYAPKIYITDLQNTDLIKQIVSETIEHFSKIDALIQNTAIYPWKKVQDLSLEDWNSTLHLTLTTPFLFTRECLPHMIKQKTGKIVYLSSIAGEQIGLPNMSAYATAKAGLNGLMRSVALEGAPHNINVNCISPGKIYDPATLSDTEQKQKVRPIPLGRFQTPADIAHLAIYLISDEARNMTGQNLILDGGQTILGEETHLSK